VGPGAGVAPAFALLLLAGVLQLVRTATASGRLERNGLVGIRTRATRRSDAAWDAGHLAAGPWLLAAAVTGCTAGLAALALAAAAAATARSGAVALVVALLGNGAVLVLVAAAARTADRAARAVQPSPEP
jgi:uncharacterized membrane protein